MKKNKKIVLKGILFLLIMSGIGTEAQAQVKEIPVNYYYRGYMFDSKVAPPPMAAPSERGTTIGMWNASILYFKTVGLKARFYYSADTTLPSVPSIYDVERRMIESSGFYGQVVTGGFGGPTASKPSKLLFEPLSRYRQMRFALYSDENRKRSLKEMETGSKREERK